MLLIIPFSLVCIFLYAIKILQNTPLCLNIHKGYVFSCFFYVNLLPIFLPLIVTFYWDFDSLGFFLAKKGIELDVAFWTLFHLFIFFTLVAFLFKVFRMDNRYVVNNSNVKKLDIDILLTFNVAVLAIGFLLFFIAFVFLGYQHAFVTAFLEGSSVLKIRLMNKYSTNLPSQISYFFKLAYLIIAFSAVIFKINKKNKTAFFLFFCSLFFASIEGSKAPIIHIFLIIYLTLFLHARQINSVKMLIIFAISPILILVILYIVLSFQIHDLDIITFGKYLFSRLGVSQMAGVYETFSLMDILDFQENNFYMHTIPFGRFFLNYIDYQKWLMMFTEGYSFSEIGVKNSLFIAEAFAIGGYFLFFFSSFIVALSYALGLWLLFRFLLFLFGKTIALCFLVPLFVSSHALTGGFASFIFLKGLILLLLHLLLIYPVFFLFKRISKLFAK